MQRQTLVCKLAWLSGSNKKSADNVRAFNSS